MLCSLIRCFYETFFEQIPFQNQKTDNLASFELLIFRHLSFQDHKFNLLWQFNNKKYDTNYNLEKDKQALSIEQLMAGNKNYLLKTDNAILGNYFNRLKSYRLYKP